MDLQRYLIVLFINILIDILHGLHSGADFDVNIYLKKTCQKRIIRDDPTIIKSTIRAPDNDLVIHYISSSIYKISVGIDCSRLIEFARETLCAGQRIVGILFNYTGRDGIQRATEAVNHRLLNNYNQRSIKIQLSIKEFNANKIVNMLGFKEGVTSMDKDDNIRIR